MADDDDMAVAAAWYFLQTSERNADKVEVKHKRSYYRRYWIHDVLRAPVLFPFWKILFQL